MPSGRRRVSVRLAGCRRSQDAGADAVGRAAAADAGARAVSGPAQRLADCGACGGGRGRRSRLGRCTVSKFADELRPGQSKAPDVPLGSRRGGRGITVHGRRGPARPDREGAAADAAVRPVAAATGTCSWASPTDRGPERRGVARGGRDSRDWHLSSGGWDQRPGRRRRPRWPRRGVVVVCTLPREIRRRADEGGGNDQGSPEPRSVTRPILPILRPGDSVGESAP